MKIRRRTDERVSTLEMTSLIDIVFQLLVFFIMTLSVVAVEGDLDLKTPLAARSSDQLSERHPPQQLLVHLRAGQDGELAGITVAGHDLTATTPERAFKALQRQVRERIAVLEPEAVRSIEVELAFDERLKYENVIAAMTAVKGYIDPATGRRVRLIEKVTFQ